MTTAWLKIFGGSWEEDDSTEVSQSFFFFNLTKCIKCDLQNFF